MKKSKIKKNLLRLLQNFSFARATAENCMFRSPQGEKLHSLGKTNRVLQEAVFIKTFLFLLLFLLLSACAPKPEEEKYITIGALLPLTGEDSDEGLRALNGLQLAKGEINEAGGVFGKKLDIIVLNDRGDEEYVLQQYNVLKEKDVLAIIGSSYSGVTMALAEASEKDGIPVITPTATDPEITQGRGNVFRANFIDDYQAEVMAFFAWYSLNAKTAVVLRNGDSASFRRTGQIFAESFIDLGGSVSAVESYSTGEDFAGILGKYASNPPNIFYCPENFIPAADLVNTVYELGLTANTHILGSDAWDGLLVYVYNPGAMKNVYYPAPFSFDDQDGDASNFVKSFFHSFSQMPLSGSATAYTCVYILAEAIKKAGSTDRNDIISAIKTNEFNMITGSIRFDNNNNPRTNVYIIQIEGGVYSTYEKISL